MEQQEFQNWLSGTDNLTKAQRRLKALSGRSERDASLAAVEQGMDEDLICPHRGEPGAARLGKNRGLLRYRCGGCGRTFSSLTGTSADRPHRKDKWLESGRCLAEGLSVRASARRCGIAAGTTFRRRHRFLEAVNKTPRKLKGIVEADETRVLQSRRREESEPQAAPARRQGFEGTGSRFDCRLPRRVDC